MNKIILNIKNDLEEIITSAIIKNKKNLKIYKKLSGVNL